MFLSPERKGEGGGRGEGERRGAIDSPTGGIGHPRLKVPLWRFELVGLTCDFGQLYVSSNCFTVCPFWG